jgi:hypothetical protein
LGDWFQKQADIELNQNQGEKIDACGSQTDIYSGIEGFKHWLGRINMPYDEFRKMDGEYKEGVGYIVKMDKVEFELFRAKHLLALTPHRNHFLGYV